MTPPQKTPPPQEKTILITGGAGYIGSQTNLYLLEQGYNTIIFDNLVYGHREVVPSDSIFIEGDLNNPIDLEQVFSTHAIDAVIHFAAYAYVGESVTNPAKYYHNNVIGTFHLLEAMRAHHVTTMVFSSTCATYGIPQTIPISEETPQNPINPYGYTKLVIEQMLKDYHHAYGLNSIYLRYFNACGADLNGRTGESHDPETHLIPLVLDAAAGKRKSITIFGEDYNTPDGTCIRDYIHTVDLASAHHCALEKLLTSDKICEPVNVGTGHGISVKEIIDAVKSITQKDFVVDHGPRRPGDPDRLIADNTKAKEWLGWTPQYSNIETIIQTAWDWYKKNN